MSTPSSQKLINSTNYLASLDMDEIERLIVNLDSYKNSLITNECIRLLNECQESVNNVVKIFDQLDGENKKRICDNQNRLNEYHVLYVINNKSYGTIEDIKDNHDMKTKSNWWEALKNICSNRCERPLYSGPSV